MKFQKYLREVELKHPHGLQNLNYKLLKAKVRELHVEAEAGRISHAEAREIFAANLRADLQVIEDLWERHVQVLRSRAFAELFCTSDALLCGDLACEGLCEPLRPVTLLDPLQPWLELAAWADSLRRHRLLQVAAVVKIEKKFVKAMESIGQTGGATGSSASKVMDVVSMDAAAMLRRSKLRDDALHMLCRQLEAFGDAMLFLGLGAGKPEALDPCAVCLDGVVDPARLPCGHRFCVHCVLPLFDACEASDSADDSDDAAMLKCPLCRAAGPEAPQALSLDGLLPRMQRGLGMDSNSCSSNMDLCRFTAIVVSSLARLATHDAGCTRLPGASRTEEHVAEGTSSPTVPKLKCCSPPLPKVHEPSMDGCKGCAQDFSAQSKPVR